jgi:hypothetical protein
MRLSLYEHPDGVETGPGNRVVYSVTRDEAHFGTASVHGHALRWELEEAAAPDAKLSAELGLDLSDGWIVRCDRIDFPPGGIAYLHTHPGPGVRRLLFGSIRIETQGQTTDYGPGGAWFEAGPDPVYAAASATADSAFVRVMLLPSEWEGKRTIRYVHERDADKPKLQRATVYFDRPVAS